MISFFFSFPCPDRCQFSHLALFFRPPVYPSNCVRDEIRGTHVRLIATRETVCCSRLETCVAHSPRYLGGSLRPVKCSINIEIAILYPARLFSDALLSFDKSLREIGNSRRDRFFGKWRIRISSFMFHRFSFLLNCPWIKEKKKKIGIFVKRDTPRNVIVNRCYNKENLDALNISYRLFLRVNTFALSFYSKQKLITHRKIYCSTSTTI